jgi:subtilisin family serine protease
MVPRHTTRRNVLKVSGSLLGGVFAGSTVVAAASDDRFVVETKHNRRLDDVEVVHEMPGVDFAVVRGDRKELKRSKAVKAFEPDIELHLDAPRDSPTEMGGVPDDAGSPTDEPYYPLQWDKQIQEIPSAHDRTQGEGTRVAVLDTGIPESHPDFQSSLNVGLSRNFTGDGGTHEPLGRQFHGTHVGGIVAADDNGTGVVGSAPATDLVDCRVFSTYGAGAAFGDILAAVVYSATIDADVANLSLGAYPIPRQGLGSFYGKVLNSVMTHANREGTLLVVAAGNDKADLQHDKNFISIPNEGAQGMSISATTSVGYLTGTPDNPGTTPASYTNYGTNAITLGAPGGDNPAGGTFRDLVLNAIPQKVADAAFGEGAPPYGYLAGTSMAAPQVAGAAALVKSANPDYNANQVEAALKRAAEVPDGEDKAYYGSGFVDVLDAL